MNTILVVENNPDDEMLIRRAFQRSAANCEVVMAHSGAEALAYLADHVPDLMLLDLKLPQMTGHEVLRRVRAADLTRFLPVIILSSSNEAKDVINSYALGANSYIQKAIDLDEFDMAVRLLVEYWFCFNLLPSRA